MRVRARVIGCPFDCYFCLYSSSFLRNTFLNNLKNNISNVCKQNVIPFGMTTILQLHIFSINSIASFDDCAGNASNINNDLSSRHPMCLKYCLTCFLPYSNVRTL